jgi:transketolase
MRNAFIQTLAELAAEDPRIVLLTGDLGYTAIEPFSERFPERFYNVGVAEQNMLGLATGLAEAGFIPFVYSIATFATLRPYEFIRNGPILHQLPVRIIGVGGGLEYGLNGLTHYAVEDIGVLRVQPGMRIIVPADPPQARNALRSTYAMPGPIYYRLGKTQADTVPGLKGEFDPDYIIQLSHGEDLLILAAGNVAIEAHNAVQALGGLGLSVGLAVVANLHPAPLNSLLHALDEVPAALTVEAHYLNGGLGSLVCEIVAEHELQCRVRRCGVRTLEPGVIGNREFLHYRHGLSAMGLVASARELITHIEWE